MLFCLFLSKKQISSAIQNDLLSVNKKKWNKSGPFTKSCKYMLENKINLLICVYLYRMHVCMGTNTF